MRLLGSAICRCFLAVFALGLALPASSQTPKSDSGAQVPARTKPANRRFRMIEQTLNPTAWLGTEQRKAEERTERTVPTRIDTRKFTPQINAEYKQIIRKPRNPQFPDWMFAVFAPNNMPVGRATNLTRTTPKTHWPAINFTIWSPPDPSLAVGKNHVVVVVNSSISFHTRTGTQLFQQTFETFLSGLGSGSFLFDPKAFYDRLSDRYFVVVLEQDDASQTSKTIVCVSDDGDPNGTWFKYRIDSRATVNGANFWLDYPGFGVNKDAVAVCGNMFGFAGGFAGVQFVLTEKAPMLTGSPTTTRYILDSNAVTAQIAQINDPAETRLFAINRQNNQFLKVHAITGPATATPTAQSSFVQIPDANSPQFSAWSIPGFLDTLDGRLMNVNYRNGKLLTSHTIDHPAFQVAKVRWYELGLGTWPASGAVSLLQSGEIVPPDSNTEYHMPAIGQNSLGDTSVIFTRSAQTIVADLMIASRKSSDAVGTLGAPTLLQVSEGTGYQGGGTNRWGDYFDVNIDPLDDFTFWGVGMVGNPNNDWRTHVFSWTVTVPVTVSVSTLTANPTTVLGGTENSTLTIQLAAAAPAGGATVNLSSNDPAITVPATATIAAGQTQTTVTATSTAVSTAKTVTVTATSGASSKTATITVRPRRVAGTITLGDYTATRLGKTVTVGVRTAGSTTNLETATVTLNASGVFSFLTDRTGTVDLAFDVPGFLRKVVRITLPTSGTVAANATLANGDADRDQRVTTTDFTLVNRAFGSSTGGTNWDVRADLNGDGTVNAADIAIVQKNQRLRGDA